MRQSILGTPEGPSSTVRDVSLGSIWSSIVLPELVLGLASQCRSIRSTVLSRKSSVRVRSRVQVWEYVLVTIACPAVRTSLGCSLSKWKKAALQTLLACVGYGWMPKG